MRRTTGGPVRLSAMRIERGHITYLLRQLLFIQRVVVIEDAQLIVDSTVLVEEELAEEWEVLGMPYVRSVTRAESNPALSNLQSTGAVTT